MPVHHRLRFLTFPIRTSRLCSLWPDMRPLRFRRVPFGRDVAFDPGGATASRIAVGSRTGAPAGVEAFRPCHVSSPLRVERSMRISRTALPHLLHVEAYWTYPAEATFGRSRRTR